MATLAVRQNILPIFGLNCHFGTVRGYNCRVLCVSVHFFMCFLVSLA